MDWSASTSCRRTSTPSWFEVSTCPSRSAECIAADRCRHTLRSRSGGWRAAAGKFGDDVPRSVADITDERSLGKVRDWKKAQKAAKLDKQDRPVS